MLTDVRDAYEGVQESDRIVQDLPIGLPRRATEEPRHQRVRLPPRRHRLLDFLDAERSYRATQLAYRQAIAAYLTALEQLRQAVGTRSLH